MAETRPSENSRDSEARQVTRREVRAPRGQDIVQLLDLDEIAQRFGVGSYHVYVAVAEGRLRAYGRPGRQKYYSLAELIEVFDEPGPDGGVSAQRDGNATSPGDASAGKPQESLRNNHR